MFFSTACEICLATKAEHIYKNSWGNTFECCPACYDDLDYEDQQRLKPPEPQNTTSNPFLHTFLYQTPTA